MSEYIPLMYVDVITCPGPKIDAGLFNLFVKHPQWPLLLTWFNFNPSMDK